MICSRQYDELEIAGLLVSHSPGVLIELFWIGVSFPMSRGINDS